MSNTSASLDDLYDIAQSRGFAPEYSNDSRLPVLRMTLDCALSIVIYEDQKDFVFAAKWYDLNAVSEVDQRLHLLERYLLADGLLTPQLRDDDVLIMVARLPHEIPSDKIADHFARIVQAFCTALEADTLESV